MIVPFLLGSKIDIPHAEKIAAILDDYGIPYEIYVCSAHKVPRVTMEIIEKFNAMEDDVVFVTMAGRSNALSGLVSGNTFRPVIACPPFKDKSDYLANIHSTLQMPSETPCITVVDPRNAGQAVARILAMTNPELATKVKNHIQVVKDGFSTEPVQ